MYTDELVKEFDEDTMRYKSCATLLLLGSEDSRFLKGIRGKCKKMGLRAEIVQHFPTDSRTETQRLIPYVRDYETFPLPKDRNEQISIVTHGFGLDCAAAMVSVSEAIATLLDKRNEISGKRIAIYGRGKSTRGLRTKLEAGGGTVEVAHSKTNDSYTCMLGKQVVIFATPTLDFRPEAIVSAGQTILDLSGVGAELDNSNLNHKWWTYIGPRDIGRLTTSILVNRFAHHYGELKKALAMYQEDSDDPV